jgi:hypothetical protein
MNILRKDCRSGPAAKVNYLSTLFIYSIKKKFRTAFVAGLAIILSAMSLVPVFSGVPVAAASTGMIPINLVFYGTHNAAIDQQIVAAKPMFLIDNTPAGPWGGNCNASYFAGYSIKVFSYIDGGDEGTQQRSVPNDLTSNLNYIDAISKESGVYGVFLDEVSAEPSSASLNYLSQIYAKAKQDGLAVMFNTGVDSWSDSLMQYCDYINSSEEYHGGTMTASQQKWASRTVLLAQNINDAATAANLTNTAVAKGFLAEYSCSSYENLPSYLTTYVSLITGNNTQVNQAPVFAPIGNQTVILGTSVQFTVSARDVDGNTLTYSVSDLPSGAIFNTGTGSFNWTPVNAGVFSITFTVSDGNLSASQNVSIDVQTAVTTTPSSTTTSLSTTTGSQTPAWDVNGDHVCNITDIAKIGNHFGETGTPGWIPEDVNKDGVINILDIVYVGNYFGQTW